MSIYTNLYMYISVKDNRAVAKSRKISCQTVTAQGLRQDYCEIKNDAM